MMTRNINKLTHTLRKSNLQKGGVKLMPWWSSRALEPKSCELFKTWPRVMESNAYYTEAAEALECCPELCLLAKERSVEVPSLSQELCQHSRSVLTVWLLLSAYSTAHLGSLTCRARHIDLRNSHLPDYSSYLSQSNIRWGLFR